MRTDSFNTGCVLCISPHPDDAALSCGGLIVRLRGQGVRVVVVNLFTRTAEDMYTHKQMQYKAQALGQERLDEDARALDLLGVGADDRFDLACLDAPFRDPRYRAYHRLMGPLGAHETGTLERLEAELRALAQELDAGLMLAPLGVGQHIDHQLAHALGSRLEAGHRVAYYEDLPYSLAPNALNLRLRRLGVPVSAPKPLQAAGEAADYYASYPVYRELPPLLRAPARLGIGLWTVAQECLTRPPAAVRRLRSETIGLADEAFERKLAAIQAYTTQFPRMFNSPTDCRDKLRAFAGSAPGYAERLWHAVPSATTATINESDSLSCLPIS